MKRRNFFTVLFAPLLAALGIAKAAPDLDFILKDLDFGVPFSLKAMQRQYNSLLSAQAETFAFKGDPTGRRIMNWPQVPGIIKVRKPPRFRLTNSP